MYNNYYYPAEQKIIPNSVKNMTPPNLACDNKGPYIQIPGLPTNSRAPPNLFVENKPNLSFYSTNKK